MPEPDASLAMAAPGGQGILALIVDDDALLADVYQTLLEQRLRAARVAKAASLQEALQVSQPPDVVLMDLGLPDTEGFSGLVALKERWPRAAIIMATGDEDEAKAGEALRRGAQDYLLKGKLDSATLIRAIRYALERKAAELEHGRMEVALRHAQKLESIGQLAAGIAHEINTPAQYIGDNLLFLREAFRDLSAFLGVQARLLEAPEDTQILAEARTAWQDADLDFIREEIPRALQQCEEGVGRVARIVGAMKEFSHPDPERRSPVNLNRSIESTATVCRNEWKYLAELELDLDASLPPLMCYPSELNQAILNLLINGAHAIADQLKVTGEEKGRIRIQTRQDSDWVEIRVEDSGTGIPESVLPRIFDPFFTTKPVGKGTGQGLAIVHAVVVEKHGGTIEVQTGPGKGACFILRIPLVGG